MTQQKLIDQLLTAGGADKEVVDSLGPALVERVLAFKVEPRPILPESAIVAFAFGNRREQNGNLSPGPVNAALAAVVERLSQQVSGRIFAQWEIAESLSRGSIDARLVPVYPVVDPARSTVQYLSTVGVLRQVLSTLSTNHAPVAVVAHHDHLWRCLHLARLVGLDGAYAPALEMPSCYDECSGQAWTRSRVQYLFHELHCRIELERAALNGLGLPP